MAYAKKFFFLESKGNRLSLSVCVLYHKLNLVSDIIQPSHALVYFCSECGSTRYSGRPVVAGAVMFVLRRTQECMPGTLLAAGVFYVNHRIYLLDTAHQNGAAAAAAKGQRDGRILTVIVALLSSYRRERC